MCMTSLMCRVIHASSFMSPVQSSPLQTLYFSLSLYIWVGKGKEAMEPRERERDESSGLCEWITGDIYSWTQKTSGSIGDQKKKLLLCSYSRPCSELPYDEIVWCKKCEQKWKEKGIYSRSFFSTFAFATFWADYKNTRRQIRKEKRNVENLFFFSLSRPSTIQII